MQMNRKVLFISIRHYSDTFSRLSY